MSKGVFSTKAVDAVKDLKDLAFFQQSISMSLGILLQHLADSWFVQLGNVVLVLRDAYLEVGC